MKVIAFDTETTGLTDPIKMIESAEIGISLENGVVVCNDLMVRRWCRGKPIEYAAMAKHYIEDEDVANEISCDEFKFGDDVEYIVGHNIDYDWKVVGSPDIRRICTLALARKLWKGESHKLLSMIYMLEREFAHNNARHAHTAKVDTKMVVLLLNHIIPKLGVTSFEQLWLESEKARIPDTMTFGKHKGILIKDVPKDYVSWYLKQPNVDEYLVRAFKGE